MSIEEKFKLKTISELDKLPTRRLLSYYRSKRFYFVGSYFFCNCCDTPMWEFTGEEYKKEEYQQLGKYMDDIKKILDTREHIIDRRKEVKKKIRYIIRAI